MLKIKISADTKEELEKVVNLYKGSYVKLKKPRKKNKDRYYTAYVYIQ